ncbi:MAG: ATP-binding cassette domain-containing protein [Paludibacteraceae bacterium]|nr:ATP-binding cassette domain-containing protein [Paludibacteraceae bacterium]
MATAIEFEHVSKQYRLGLVSTRTLAHDIRRFWITNVLHKEDPYLKIGETNDRATKGTSEYVWALRDIDFKVEQGDVVGIIGKNGAGKSTLLKLLSRVTGPTTGTIRAHGRIGSLLEVGTGFHGEMTGRENIFMNGAILGMTRKEIQAKLDEIIDFSGCERYIDTPVKRYSSGMTVRLGFAVAAFLEPEILVVDEVLAVGDAEFQKKAIGKMKDVSQGEGRTVLFVSHNMTSIRSLCTTGVLLEKGCVKQIGQVDAIVSMYLKGDSEVFNYKNFENIVGSALRSPEFDMLEIGVRKKGGTYDDVMSMTNDIEVYMRYSLKVKKNLQITLHVKNEQGEAIFSCSGGDRCYPCEHDPGEYEQIMLFPANFFNWGTYALDVYIVEDREHSILRDYDVVTFTVANRAHEIGTFMGKEPGDITPQFEFKEKMLN